MNWELVYDVALPVAAILVPSSIAVWLAGAERVAAKRQRKALQVGDGVGYALDSMHALVSAAYADDFRRAAALRLEAGRHLDGIRFNLGEDNKPAWEWIAKELSIAAGGLNDTDETGLPVLAEKIVWRGARFGSVLSDWRLEKISLDWFATARHQKLEDTTLPTGDDDDPNSLN
ncbi:hypothetical protein I6E81_06425 [Salinibacterium sp. NG22]|uniref:hypothetical protein n=1 Tax=Salinibacterium sp. NG22 TaxID=2792040 RepID=UPI0018CCC900|nr:hypothetical protein [Salinibacterium sp. NG22]MBH0109798.1 hypothetical protein [Salinibacterium sp. NG22]